MKALEFIYMENEIHFLLNPTDKNVMINATEMAKVFGKSTKIFLRQDHTKTFIEVLKRVPKGPLLDPWKEAEIISFQGRNGMFFNRILALKFAAWLDPEFELWVFSKMDEIIFGNYKKHWDAHAKQETAKIKMNDLRTVLLTNPTPEKAREYFDAERIYKESKNEKSNSIRSQLRLFGS